MNSNEIREAFLKFFENKGHKRVASSSLVPAEDPTLLFTNAGMNQFKSVFEGKEKRDYTCAVSCQKCVRAGGKHNDLDNVGYTARHNTFFEMLGNFSFSEYFKKEAIEYAWEFLTEVLKLPVDKLYVSVFREDDEAFDIWNKHIGIQKERIFRFDEKDNFWAMGPTGPCGPNSEIFYDFGEKYGCGSQNCTVGCECDRYVEVWNNVFMQFERKEDGEMIPLPQPGIDTGMGFERIVAVMQHVHSNYEIDIFRDIIEEISKITGKTYNKEIRDNENVAFRVIADHARCLAFLIGDGVLPGNEGRNYVLRRIARRAIRYGSFLMNEPFIYRLVDVIDKTMGEAYSEIREKKDFIKTIIKKEEELFLSTLKQGTKILDDMIEKHQTENKTEFSGKDVFILYDTYGFPYDLTEIILKEKSFSINEQEYKDSMKQQKERSRKNWKGNAARLEIDEYFKIKEQTGEVEFTGYTSLIEETTVIYVKDNMFITSKTPFYGESGGQVGDKGKVYFSGGDEVEIIDTIKPVEGLIIHIADSNIPFEKGEKVKLAVDENLRRATERHHSATHLLHNALRKVVGNHAEQSGSYVNPERMRFDFKHFNSLTDEEIKKIELEVNSLICKNFEVSKVNKTIDEAKKMGATALFGEKYGDKVRVVTMGPSMELCGGCHVNRTGDIGFFKIVSESSIAASVRRIEACCGLEALKYVNDNFAFLADVQNELKVKPEEIPARIRKMKEDFKVLRKEITELKTHGAAPSMDFEFEINNAIIKSVVKNGLKPDELREVVDKLVENKENSAGIAFSENEGKVNIVVKVTRDLSTRLSAGNIVKEVATYLEGRGGGKPEMAQGAGNNVEKLKNIDKKLEEIVKTIIK